MPFVLEEDEEESWEAITMSRQLRQTSSYTNHHQSVLKHLQSQNTVIIPIYISSVTLIIFLKKNNGKNKEIFQISMQLKITTRAEVFTDRALKDN